MDTYLTRKLSHAHKWQKSPICKKICPQCGKGFVVKSYTKQQICCERACSDKYRIRKKQHTCPGCGKDFFTRPGSDQKFCSIPCSAKNARKHRAPLSEEVKDRISRKLCRLYEKGLFNPFWNYKTGRMLLKRHGVVVHYRSSYEKKALSMLDKCEEVTSIQVEPIRIPYTNPEGRIRRYIPDIVVQLQRRKKYVIEVKSNCFAFKSSNVCKYRAAWKYCKDRGMLFLMMTEDVLFPSDNGSTTTSLQEIVRATAAIPVRRLCYLGR